MIIRRSSPLTLAGSIIRLERYYVSLVVNSNRMCLPENKQKYPFFQVYGEIILLSLKLMVTTFILKLPNISPNSIESSTSTTTTPITLPNNGSPPRLGYTGRS